MPQTFTYDPYSWLLSMFRSLKEYISVGINDAEKHFENSVGLQAFEILFDWPAARLEASKLPFRNGDGKPVTLIHFVIDSIDNQPLGFGSSEFSETYYPQTGTIVPEEAESHEINFDVGVWATDESGGSSARLEAYRVLDSILSGPVAQNACQSATGGVEVRSFSGGRFLTETVNDIRIYRVADVELVARVFSSKLVVPSWASEIVQIPELMIDETVIIDVGIFSEGDTATAEEDATVTQQ